VDEWRPGGGTVTACLEGLKVIEMARFQAGPRVGLGLSDLGAEVIKIEKLAPAGYEDDRKSPPTVRGQSVYFATYNRGKKSVCLDLRTPGGMGVLKELLAQADFVVQNFRPGTMEKMGLGYEQLCAIKKDVILVSVSGFGQYGPYRERPGFDSLGQAMSGLSLLTGQGEGKPIPTASSIIDRVTALHGTIGALAALHHRTRTGEGQVVDVCLLDSALTLVEVPNAYYLDAGEEGGETSRPVYQTRDGWVVVAANSRTIAKLMAAVGASGDGPATIGLFGAPDSGIDARKQVRNPLGQQLVDWCAERTVDEVVTIMGAHDVPCAPVRSTPQVVKDPHVWEREMIVKVPDAIAGEIHVPGIAFKFSKTSGSVGTVPTLGQHTDEVLGRWLRYDAHRLATLRAEAAIG